MNELKGRPEDIAFDTSMEYFFDIKVNSVGLLDSFDFGEVFSFCQLDGLISLKIEFDVFFEVINQVLRQGSVIDTENDGSIHFRLKVL